MAPRTPSLFAPDTPASHAQFITAHCDGGARGNPGPSGYGVEITDAHGNVLAELSEFLGFRTNNFAEYSGLLASLQYALDHGHPTLRVISDSLLMVKQIQGAYKVKSPDLIPLWQEAKRRISKLDHFEIAHALRHKNKAADRLANQAMDRGMSRGPQPDDWATGRGTTADGRPLHLSPDARLTTENAVQSLPLRAIAYPAQAPPPSSLDPAPQPPRPTPTRATHAPILLASDASRASTPTSAAKPSDRTPPAQTNTKHATDTTMLRGFTRNGTIHLLGSETLPDGIFVKVIPE